MTTAPSNTPVSEFAPSSEPSVPQLPQSGVTTLEMQRQLLQQKLAEKAGSEYTSPTDQMMTPCSKKLQDHKKKAFSKAKPTSLSSRFAMAGATGNSNKKKSSGLFGEPTAQ